MIFEIEVYMWITFILIILSMLLYFLDKIRIEIIALGTITALLLLFQNSPILGVVSGNPISLELLLQGFANPALIALMSLLIIGQGLLVTGAFDSFNTIIGNNNKYSEYKLLLVMVLVLILSALLNNTPIIIMFIPIIISLSRQLNRSARMVLLPLSYVCILGGITTLIGSSTNLLVSGATSSLIGKQIGFFEFTKQGLVLASVGFIYVTLILPKILGKNSRLEEEDDEISNNGKQYFVEISLDSENTLLGKSFISGLLPDLKDATINLIIRDNEKILPPFDDIKLQTNDRLVIAITKNELIQKIKSNDKIFNKIGYENDKSDRELIIEVAVSPSSFMIGRTINQTNFETETNCKVIGLQRERKFDRDSPRSQKLSQENILLIRGGEELIRRLRAHKDIFPIEWSAISLPLKKFSQRSRIIFAVTIISAATGFLNITTAALLGAALMLIFKVLSIKEALSSLDIKIYLLVASTLMLSTVLQETGGAKLIADTLILLTNNLSIPTVLSLLFIVIAIITNFLSNNATAVLFTPIAINLANDFQMQPEPFIFCVIFAANCSFATPIGYQTNLLVMGPGGYKFVDYLKSGIPLIIILWITYSLTVYFWI